MRKSVFPVALIFFLSVSFAGCAAYQAGVETVMGDPEEWNEMLEKFEKYKVKNEGKKGAPSS